MSTEVVCYRKLAEQEASCMLHFHSEKRIHYSRCLMVLLIGSVALLSYGCNKRYVEGPEQGNNIWGFGNKDKLPYGNTYKEENASNAAENSYTYYSAQDFATLILENKSNNVSVYSSAYQERALKQLSSIKESKVFTIENPLFIQNPFGTNQNGLYLFIGTPTQKVRINYTISVPTETISDFGDSLYINRTLGQEVEGQMIGLIEGQRNKLVLTISDLNGTVISKKAYYFDIAATSSEEAKLSTQYGTDPIFTRGVFSYFHKDGDHSSFQFYDNHGVLRAKIPTSFQRAEAKVLQVENQIFYPIKENEYVLVNNLGNVIQRYQYTEDGKLFDCDYDAESKKIIFLANTEANPMITRGIALDPEKGEWKDIVSFENLLKAGKPNDADDAKDWLQLSSVQVIEGKDILVCSKELSTVFRINNVYTGPVIRWIISEDKKWLDTSYESLLLTETGEKTSKNSIDSMYYGTNRKLTEDQIFLSLLNYETKDKTNADKYSVFYKYLVEESQNRYRLIQKVIFPYHKGQCSSMLYGNHIILSFGQEKQFVEYDEKGNIIATYQIPDGKAFYRVYKYTMDRYWF